MFQNILPHIFNISYQQPKPENDDYIITFNHNQVLTHTDEKFHFPTITDILHYCETDVDELIYLFDIDGKKFFLSPIRLPEGDNFMYHDVRSLRNRQPRWVCFGAATAMHLAQWYANNSFCGKCACKTLQKDNERALQCPQCGLIVYPRINPVVIVGVTDGNRLLLTKNSNSEYKNYGLISGFMEVGESFEDTVKREVMEEAGLNVKNIHYYKSQPWAFSESVLAGFFVEVDGNKEPVLDGLELTEAVWFDRAELPLGDVNFSLTWYMIENFRQGKI